MGLTIKEKGRTIMSYSSRDMLANLNSQLHDDRITSEQLERAKDYKKSLDDYMKESERIAREKAEKLKKAQEQGNFTKSMTQNEKDALLLGINKDFEYSKYDIAKAESNRKERQTIEKLLDIQMDKKEQALKKLELAKSDGDPEKIADVMAECEIVNRNIATYQEQLKAIQ